MQIRVEGKGSIKDVADAICKSLEMIAGCGVSSLSDVNLYFTVYDQNGEETELVGPKNEPISIFYKVNAEPKQKKVEVTRNTKANPRFKVKNEVRSAV